MAVRRRGAMGVQPRYRTSVAGGAVIVPASKRALYEHVARAVRSAERGERAFVRAVERPEQLVRFELTDSGTLLVSTFVADREVFKADPLCDRPAWFDDALQIAERVTSVPYERSLLND